MKLTSLLSIVLLLFSVLLLLVTNQYGSTEDEPLEKIKSLPYLNYVEEPESRKNNRNVTIYDKELAYDGLNLYNNHLREPAGAYLMDMEGKLLHRWEYKDKPDVIWKTSKLNKDGTLIALLRNKNPGLIKLDWNSNVLFQVRGRFHHYLDIADDGTIFVLSSNYEKISHNDKTFRLAKYNNITVISKDGGNIKDISLTSLFSNEKSFLNYMNTFSKQDSDEEFDPFHANTIEVIDKDVDGICKQGDILISVRNLNLIAIIDLEKQHIKWSWGENELEWQHHPRFLDNGNIMIFDNGVRRGYSRIIELNPKTRQIEWEYTAEPKTSFFTKERGGNQRLPNGNTLIAESNTGRAFEITRNGKIVWEWFNPHFYEGKRSVIYQMDRFDKIGVTGLVFNYGNSMKDNNVSPANPRESSEG